jgi:hypothetical protein
MKIRLTYEYDSTINNSRICIVRDGDGKTLAKGYHSQSFEEAKWSALREAQRVALRRPVTIPEPEEHDIDWGLPK